MSLPDVDPSCIRNFCMLAHVDHGKTTLTDHLISSNGIISSQLAGRVRYLDTRPDEQDIEITMKASSIALRHETKGEMFLMHVVDSPGHVDFSSEVSTAVRVCDGALVLVDVIDGVSMQTQAMLLQCHKENLRVCLVLTKIDLLVEVQKLSVLEAYDRIRTIIEGCNVARNTFINMDKVQAGLAIDDDEAEDGEFFNPSKGNVAFLSSLDGWGFTVDQFARLFEEKLNLREGTLANSMWGNLYLNPKTGTVSDTKKREDQQPTFVQLVLEPLWGVYNAFLPSCSAIPSLSSNVNTAAADGVISEKPEVLQSATKMATRLGINPAVFVNKDIRNGLSAFLRTWMPLSKAILDMIANSLPSPVEAQSLRLPKFIPELTSSTFNWSRLGNLKDSLLNCRRGDSPDDPCVVYIAKLVDMESLAGNTATYREGDEPQRIKLNSNDAVEEAARIVDQGFVGFARVLCGTLRKGMRVTVQSPNVPPVHDVEIQNVFLLRGRGLDEVPSVSAGRLCGVGGVSRYVHKFATISNVPTCPPLRSLSLLSTSIVRHSLEPVNPSDLLLLQCGLQILNQVDPQIEVGVLSTGQHIISCAGEMHAERCVRDLREYYAGIEVKVSEPIVTFRETIVETSIKRPKIVTVTTVNKHVAISVYALALPAEVIDAIKEKGLGDRSFPQLIDTVGDTVIQEKGQEGAGEWKKWRELSKKDIWAIGPHKTPTCLLIDETSGLSTTPAPQLDKAESPSTESPADVANSDMPSMRSDDSYNAYTHRIMQHYKESIVAGFNLAVNCGPVCEEPLFGIVFVVSEVALPIYHERQKQAAGVANTEDDVDLLAGTSAIGGPMSGQIMSATQKACAAALQHHPFRIVEPIYWCSVYSSGTTQGKIYSVLSRRRAAIQDEVLIEGSDIFHIDCYLPVAQSFGLATELRTETSGAASAQLAFHHWEAVDEDPMPSKRVKTAEELEDEGENAPVHQNAAQQLVEKIRRRKGIHKELLIDNAEKQKKFSVRGS